MQNVEIHDQITASKGPFKKTGICINFTKFLL